MSDLICRKTMMRCPTPGTCSPHGGCQSQHARDSAELRRLCSERDQLREKVAELEAGNESLRLVRDEYKRHADEYRAKWAAVVVAQAPVPTVEPAPSDVSVPRELLEQIAVELEHDNDRYFLGRELRALLNGGRS